MTTSNMRVRVTMCTHPQASAQTHASDVRLQQSPPSDATAHHACHYHVCVTLHTQQRKTRAPGAHVPSNSADQTAAQHAHTYSAMDVC